MTIPSRRSLVCLQLAVAMALAGAFGSHRIGLAQAAQPAVWTGWARCDVTVRGSGYTDQQTHTWTLAGGAPTIQGAFRIYPGTWSLVGGGSLTRTQGGQTLQAEWATHVSPMEAPLAVFVRASDGRMFIQARHAQLRAPGAVQGYQQQTIDGVPQQPASLALEAFEWTFPTIEVSPLRPAASGSSSAAAGGSVGPMQPAGSQVSASCTWQFGQSGSAPAPPPMLTARATPQPGVAASAGDAVPLAPAPAILVASAPTPPPPPASPAGRTPPAQPPVNTGTTAPEPATVASAPTPPPPPPADRTPPSQPPVNTGGTAPESPAPPPTFQRPSPPLDTGGASRISIDTPAATAGPSTACATLTMDVADAFASFSQRVEQAYASAMRAAASEAQRQALARDLERTRTAIAVQQAKTALEIARMAESSRCGPELLAGVTDALNSMMGAVDTSIAAILPSPAPATTRADVARTTPVAGTPPARPASGVYLVTFTGLLCGEATVDDDGVGLDLDGRGDEAYAVAYVRVFNRTTHQLLESTVRQTLPYGDVTNYATSRLQGGTQTPTGGIRGGDRIPAALTAARTIPARESAFPMKVWEGRLTDGVDALLVSPGVWEYDGAGTARLQEWVQTQAVLNHTIFADAAIQGRIASPAFAPLEVGATRPMFPTNPLEMLIGGRQDRPLGVKRLGSGATLPNVTIVLTREIIEQALAAPWPRLQPTAIPGFLLDVPKPGILVLQFVDARTGSRAPAAYSVVVQVEKVSD